jgi:predicted nucleic acid-binding protein
LTPTPRVVLDSWAWLELFSGSEKGRKVDRELAGSEGAFTSTVTLAEVVSVSLRRRRSVEDKVAAIRGQSRVVSPSSDDALDSGRLHAEMKRKAQNFSLADAFVLQLARKVGGKVLTADPDFLGIKEAEFL